MKPTTRKLTRLSGFDIVEAEKFQANRSAPAGMNFT